MIFDTDAHVEESAETFAALARDAGLAAWAPRVVPGEQRAFWMIEGKIFPKLAGKGVHTFGTPHLHNGAVDATRKARIESQELSDPAARLADMDKEGIDVSVNFPTLFLTYPVAEDPQVSRLLCRTYNDWIAGKSEGSQGRLRWVAALPWPDVEGAIEEMRRVKQRGAVGVLLLGTCGDRNWDDPRIFPFYEEAQALSMPLCVHVGWSYPPLTELYDNVYRSMISPFVLPMFMAFTAFVGGLLDRFPRLKVGFFEAGVEWVPYWVDRLERFYRQPPGGTTKADLPEREPIAYVKSGNLCFSCELDERRIAEVAEVIGDDCIVYASDLPHAHRVFNAIELFRSRQDLPSRLKEKILGPNGARFFNLA